MSIDKFFLKLKEVVIKVEDVDLSVPLCGHDLNCDHTTYLHMHIASAKQNTFPRFWCLDCEKVPIFPEDRIIKWESPMCLLIETFQIQSGWEALIIVIKYELTINVRKYIEDKTFVPRTMWFVEIPIFGLRQTDSSVWSRAAQFSDLFLMISHQKISRRILEIIKHLIDEITFFIHLLTNFVLILLLCRYNIRSETGIRLL